MSEEIMVEVTKHYLAESKNGTPSVKIQLKSMAPDGEILYYDCWLTDSCYKQTIKTLREALKWDGSNLSDLNGTGLLVGTKCAAVIADEEYNGKTQRKVKFLNAIGGQKSNMKPERLAEIQEGFSTALRTYDDAETEELFK